jgi:hypothetical protein
VIDQDRALLDAGEHAVVAIDAERTSLSCPRTSARNPPWRPFVAADLPPYLAHWAALRAAVVNRHVAAFFSSGPPWVAHDPQAKERNFAIALSPKVF